MGNLTQQLNGYSLEEIQGLRIFYDSWYHLTRHSGYTAQHNTPMASWSGVYCVDPGDAVADKPNNGTLRFLEARSNAGMYLYAGNAHWRPPFGLGEIAFNLKPSQLLLFPSHPMREVAPYYGQRERITVAFNASGREAGSSGHDPMLRQRG